MRIWVGYGPKQYATIIRFQATLNQMADTPARAAVLASENGFFDQAHLALDLNRFADATPTRLASVDVADFSKTRCDGLSQTSTRSRGTDMSKKILGVIAGLAVWAFVVTVVGEIMRSSWPAYAKVADAMTFTLPMLIARLSISVVATLAAGLATATIIRHSRVVRVMPGVLLLAAFIPVHVGIWDKLPV